MTETVLEEASRLVSTDRGASYGHPADDFTRAAKIWSVILGVEVTAAQVGLCQIGTKLAREVNSRKRDNLVDVAGYARCVEMVYERQEDAAKTVAPEKDEAALKASGFIRDQYGNVFQPKINPHAFSTGLNGFPAHSRVHE